MEATQESLNFRGGEKEKKIIFTLEPSYIKWPITKQLATEDLGMRTNTVNNSGLASFPYRTQAL